MSYFVFTLCIKCASSVKLGWERVHSATVKWIFKLFSCLDVPFSLDSSVLWLNEVKICMHTTLIEVFINFFFYFLHSFVVNFWLPKLFSMSVEGLSHWELTELFWTHMWDMSTWLTGPITYKQETKEEKEVEITTKTDTVGEIKIEEKKSITEEEPSKPLPKEKTTAVAVNARKEVLKVFTALVVLTFFILILFSFFRVVGDK